MNNLLFDPIFVVLKFIIYISLKLLSTVVIQFSKHPLLKMSNNNNIFEYIHWGNFSTPNSIPPSTARQPMVESPPDVATTPNMTYQSNPPMPDSNPPMPDSNLQYRGVVNPSSMPPPPDVEAGRNYYEYVSLPPIPTSQQQKYRVNVNPSLPPPGVNTTTSSTVVDPPPMTLNPSFPPPGPGTFPTGSSPMAFPNPLNLSTAAVPNQPVAAAAAAAATAATAVTVTSTSPIQQAYTTKMNIENESGKNIVKKSGKKQEKNCNSTEKKCTDYRIMFECVGCCLNFSSHTAAKNHCYNKKQF